MKSVLVVLDGVFGVFGGWIGWVDGVAMGCDWCGSLRMGFGGWEGCGVVMVGGW